jgi:hypothetical protein
VLRRSEEVALAGSGRPWNRGGNLRFHRQWFLCPCHPCPGFATGGVAATWRRYPRVGRISPGQMEALSDKFLSASIPTDLRVTACFGSYMDEA